ncbi:MAG TPA: ribosome recycling factor [Candidatus Paceibacterota bacterium]|nr:ribosome recycling factor [Candidatus Paceibacterota bacterium]
MNQQLEKNLKELEVSMKDSVESLKKELQNVRGNRPSVEILENVKVNCYDQMMELKQLGSLSLRPPREIDIQLWDKGITQQVVRAIEDAKIGMGVSSDGNIIRASLPSLTDERRKELVKLAGKMTESAKIRLRGHRDDAIKKFKSAEEKAEITEDDLFQAKDKTQKLIDDANRKMDEMLASKTKEIEE